MKDRDYLINMYNATSTDDGTGNDEIETYEAWLERQLLSRIEKYEGRLMEIPENKGFIIGTNVCVWKYDESGRNATISQFTLMAEEGMYLGSSRANLHGSPPSINDEEYKKVIKHL